MPLHPHWAAEDQGFWQDPGRGIARRNLWLSIPALSLAFAVWMLWSVVVVQLPAAGFHYSTNQLFWLTALPALCGATLRIFQAFAMPLLGGRRFTALATASLLLPAIGLGLAVQDPSTSYEWMVALALLCGLGGGNLASSMVPIGFVDSEAGKGGALGLNTGLGHLGIALVQAVVPLVIAVGLFGPLGGAPQATAQGPLWLQNAGFVWVPLIAASALAAWFGMDDLAEARAGFAEQAVIFSRRHNWLMCWLYLGSFGSFIGLSAGLPMLLHSQFDSAGAAPHPAWAAAGPLLGALLRPLGGWLADRAQGGARLALWCFVGMALGAGGVLWSLPAPGQGGHFGGFVAGFGLLFAASGLANGSVFHMLLSIFVGARRQAVGRLPTEQAQATQAGNVEAAAVLGFASAIGAYGGFFIPKSYGTAIALTGSPAAALGVFIAFYVSCIAVTWWFYSRRHATMPC